MAPNNKRFSIDPLSRYTKEGVLYFRRELTIRQLEELQTAPDGVIERRVLVEQEEMPDSLKSETLAFLYRLYREADTELSGHIFVTLTLRIEPILQQFREDFLISADFDDFIWDVNIEVLERLGDLGTNVADYAQVSFGQWVMYLAKNIKKKYDNSRRMERYAEIVDTPSDSDDGNDRTKYHDPVDTAPRHDLKLLADEAIKLLKEPKRTAWYMKNVCGMKIHSKDDSEETISKRFGVSEKTIRNWLDSAEETLKEWKTATN